jgi:hypothetical protein
MALGFGICACASAPPGSTAPTNPASSEHESMRPAAMSATAGDRDAATAPGAASIDAGASGSRCHGHASSELVASLLARATAVRPCYERQLRDHPRLSGRMVLAVSIGDNGEVQGVEITRDEPGDESLRLCVTRFFETARFPAPLGGCIAAKVPLSFVPRQAPDGDAGATTSDGGSPR